MTIIAGTKLGPYEIISAIGAGGMGEVYRARDSRLNRDVAIKVLPEEFAGNAERMARFQREAQVLASLNHPNIASIHGLEESIGVRALVMELVEGTTLAERIARGPISIDDALPIAKQITEALEAAHEKGIVHRDLKPANVIITPDGVVKVLDFGLAKALQGESAEYSPTTSPTLTIASTQAGVIIGTAAYMSPEQARGKGVDRRADIWGFGTVLFEMLTGKQAFSGETVSDTLAAVLRSEPEWASLPTGTPAAILHLLHRCLEKDPKRRLRDIGEARVVLSEPNAAVVSGTTLQALPASTQPLWRRALPWMLAALLGISLAALALSTYLSHPRGEPLLRSAINLPSGFHLDTQNSSLALSPDGRKLAIAAVGPDGKGQIWIRSMDSLTIQPVVGTEGASYPFWSPDSRYIGFFAGLKLKKIELSSGIVQTLCVAGEGRGASWSRTGMIVYAPQAFGGLYMLPASGGTPVQVTTVESQSISNRLPHFLPDGKRLLFFSGTDSTAKDNGIFLLDLDSRKITLVTKENSEGFYVEPGYLVFVRNRDLMAQPFDLKRLQTTGQAIPIAEQVVCNPGRWTGEYSLAESGLLVFQSGSGVYRSQLTWFDTDGKKLGTVGEPAGFLSISISPDQKRALTLILGNDSHQDLWMYDLVRGVASRFSFGNSDIGESVWSPDGRRVFYDVAIGSLYWKASDGSLEPHELATGVPVNYVAAVSPDGKMLAFMTQTTQGGDIWLLPLEGNQKARPFIVTAASETKGSFSPDGRWFAYISDETGRDELFVVSFPGPGGKRQISSDGADFPQWLEGGRKLVYINAGRKLISVDINSKGQELEIGQSHSLFGGHPLPAVPQDSSSWGTPVYITSDGKRILLPVPLEESPPPPLTLVTNWTAELKK